LQRGRLGVAEQSRCCASVLDTNIRIHSPDNYNVGNARANLGLLLHDEGESLREAEAEFRQALAIYDKTLPAKHPWRATLLMHVRAPAGGPRRTDEARRPQRDAIPKDLGRDVLGLCGASPRSRIPFTPMRSPILGHSSEAADELSAAVRYCSRPAGPE